MRYSICRPIHAQQKVGEHAGEHSERPGLWAWGWNAGAYSLMASRSLTQSLCSASGQPGMYKLHLRYLEGPRQDCCCGMVVELRPAACLASPVSPNAPPPHYAGMSEQNVPAELYPQCTSIEYTLTRAPPPHPPVYLFVVDTCLEEMEINACRDSISQVRRRCGGHMGCRCCIWGTGSTTGACIHPVGGSVGVIRA